MLHGDKDKNFIVVHGKLMHQKILEEKQNVTFQVARGDVHGSGGQGWGNHNQIVFDLLIKRCSQLSFRPEQNGTCLRTIFF